MKAPIQHIRHTGSSIFDIAKSSTALNIVIAATMVLVIIITAAVLPAPLNSHPVSGIAPTAEPIPAPTPETPTPMSLLVGGSDESVPAVQRTPAPVPCPHPVPVQPAETPLAQSQRAE
jgi:hypothetical protein